MAKEDTFYPDGYRLVIKESDDERTHVCKLYTDKSDSTNEGKIVNFTIFTTGNESSHGFANTTSNCRDFVEAYIAFVGDNVPGQAGRSYSFTKLIPAGILDKKKILTDDMGLSLTQGRDRGRDNERSGSRKRETSFKR